MASESIPDNGSGKDEQKGKSKTVIIMLLAIVVVALVGVLAFVLGQRSQGTAEPEESRRGLSRPSMRDIIVDENNASNMMDAMREEVEEGMFECQMSMNWTFADGSAKSRDAYVANSTNNTHPIYFDVYLEDTEELLYSSPVIPVGSELQNFALDSSLPAGDYRATVMYTLLKDAESQEEISSAGFVITIKVLN